MAYLALYRRWRPQCFSDVVGQGHVVKTLKNELKQGHIAHAYLFCGPRGTGKTSMAKILAKSLNCMQPLVGEPCNKCELCDKITKGYAPDVMEIDAASNRGIDEIRELREKIKFVPAEGKYKVYIIDEVHMMTTEAFNALLKTLEEPPAHVVFILATTEPHKLPATILSRCQRFDFHRLSICEITTRLEEIVSHQNVGIDSDALSMIARAAEGGMRDALSLLDQCIAIGEGEISLLDVEAILGRVSETVFFDLLEAIINDKPRVGLERIQQLYDEGKDLSYFLQGLTIHIRNLLITKTCQDANGLVEGNPDYLACLKKQSEALSQEQLLQMLTILGQARSEMKWTMQPRILLETTFIKLRQILQIPDSKVLLSRIEDLEKAIKNRPFIKDSSIKEELKNTSDKEPLLKGQTMSTKGQTMSTKVDHVNSIAANTNCSNSSESSSESIKPEQWEAILRVIKQEHILTYAWLVEGKPEKLEDDKLTISFGKKYTFHKENIEKPESCAIIEKAVEKVLHKKIKVYSMLEKEKNTQTKKIDVIKKDPLVKEALELFGGEIIGIRHE